MTRIESGGTWLRRGGRTLLLGCLLAMLTSAVAEAERIDVDPGRFAIQEAVDRAKAGDTLVVHRGTYRQGAVISKRLLIRGPRHGQRPLLDGGCEVDTTLRTLVGEVKLKRLRLRGAISFAVDFASVESGTARELKLVDTCGGLYGINVFDSGPIKVIGNEAHGFLDAGIYVGGINDTRGGTLVVEDNVSSGNNRGLIVEDSVDPGVEIRVSDNVFDDNTLAGEGDPSGIFLHNADGVLLERNQALGNGIYGIDVDAGSDATRLFGNDFSANPFPVSNNGSGTCGSDNTPNPFPACP